MISILKQLGIALLGLIPVAILAGIVALGFFLTQAFTKAFF